MAQADGIVSNASGAAVRADLNNQLAAVFTNHSGATEPSTTYAYQWWADTVNGVMKLRNATNTAWITLFQLDGEWTTLAVENGSAASPSIYFKDSGTDTGVYSPGTDQVAITTAGAQRVNFNGTTEVVFNDGGADVDFRIEGDTEENLFKIDAGTDQVQVKNLNGGPLAGTRNRIINGDMRINQRNAAVTTDTAYSVDRWALNISSTGAVSLAGNTGIVPAGFTNALFLDVTTADTSIAAGEFLGIIQPVEGFNVADLAYGTASAKTATLSFWIRSTTTGTYCVSFVNSTNNRSYVATYTISAANTWEYKTVTVPGDTSGTWLTNNGIGLTVRFAFAAGTTYQTTAGSWQAGNFLATSAQTNLLALNTNDAYITGVQLEAGTVATPFEQRSYGQELALCQRYYEKTSALGYGAMATGGSFFRQLVYYFKSEMRTTPTISVTFDTGTPSSQNATVKSVELASSVGNTTSAAYVTSLTASAEL